MSATPDFESREPIKRLSRDLREAAKNLSPDEARFLVDAYYTMQENRKRSDNQVRALGESAEPHSILIWLADNSRLLENQIKAALDHYSNAQEVGVWARSIKGIGPVITAGLLAHIDITRAPTAGHIWRYAGLDPTMKWEKGKKRPWNASLKTLCWKIGESFVKVSGDEEAFYAQLYVKRKEAEIAKNEAGDFAEQASAKLERFKIGKTTEAFKWYSGEWTRLKKFNEALKKDDPEQALRPMLPPGHIHARAKRYAVKLFLSHLQEKMYEAHYGKAPPLPYPIAILGHAHKI